MGATWLFLNEAACTYNVPMTTVPYNTNAVITTVFADRPKTNHLFGFGRVASGGTPSGTAREANCSPCRWGSAPPLRKLHESNATCEGRAGYGFAAVASADKSRHNEFLRTEVTS